MLTATYSIVTLKLEQENMRWNFSALQQTILSSIKNLNHVSSMEFESMLNSLSQFEQYCQQRKVEIFIVPALRKFTREADTLLDELDSLSQHCFSILCKLRVRLQQVMREDYSRWMKSIRRLNYAVQRFIHAYASAKNWLSWLKELFRMKNGLV